MDTESEIPVAKNLSTFLQTITLLTDADENQTNNDTVTLMSVHAAKGLEFKSVFVSGLEENVFPSYQALEAFNVDEERRLFYVAITRAEEHLCLTYANSRYQYGNMRFNDPSRFLEEISTSNLDSVMSIQVQKTGFPEPKKLTGKFGLSAPKSITPLMDPADFTPADPKSIKVGMTIYHLKFGEGDVKSIDERRVATIFFSNQVDNPEKRIMLDFSKLQIISEG
ncbi:MAG: 3'-5' exonuclease [Saprospiraceae bacterium]